jgi:hypothetical protein
MAVRRRAPGRSRTSSSPQDGREKSAGEAPKCARGGYLVGMMYPIPPSPSIRLTRPTRGIVGCNRIAVRDDCAKRGA